MDRHELDEYMEELWYLSEDETPCLDDLKKHGKPFSEEVIAELQQQGLVSVGEEGSIALTEKGYDQSRQIVRCHRLAERLLTDVLGMKPRETEEGACDFEHVVVPGIADSICTLLGHPRECPHGLKIPEGECCKGARATLSSAIVPLERVKIGDTVKVSYINTPSNSRMHKLAHFGIIPGSSIKVHQRYPAFVIECENAQVAMEEDIAREVFVLYPEADYKEPGQQKQRRWGLRGRGRKRRKM